MKLSNTFCAQSLLLCLILNLSALRASGQGFVWAQNIASFTSVGNRSVSACITDGNNNGYFVGSFHGATDFGQGYMNVMPGGYYDLFILKKDVDGNLLWMKQIKGTNISTAMCRGRGIGLDDAGNIYIAGSFNDSFDFDPGSGVHQLGAYSNGNYYGSNGFILKLDPAGNFIWVKEIGNPTAITAMNISCMKMDGEGNIFFACSVGGTASPVTIDVDPGPGVNDIFCPAAGVNDILIEKLDSAGNFVWVKQIFGDNNMGPYGLALDAASNVHITGQFRGTADFDPGLGVSNLSATYDFDAFIAKYDSAGNYVWAGQIGGGEVERGYGIATDIFGNILVTGEFQYGTCDFDPGPGVYNITTSAPHDPYILKLRSDGSFVWAKVISSYGGGTAIAADGEGNVYMSAPSFLRKMDSTGNLVWSKSFNVSNWTGDIRTADIVFDQDNDMYLIGGSEGTIDLNPGPGVFQGHDAFILKLCGESLALAITANNDTICPQGENVHISTTVISGATYTWTCNGAVVAGNNSNTITTSQPGIYEVYVDGGCPSASGQVYIYDCYGNLFDGAGTEEMMKAAGIYVFPNPFDEVLSVKGLQANDVVTLTDVTGRVVHSWQGSLPAETFPISDVSAGYYVLKVMNEDGVVRVNVPVVKR